jgi:REP element-mobilizing transposase RayT
VGWLRKRHIYAQVRRGLAVVWHRSDFRVVHFSIQGHHIHLVCEARDKAALATGIQAFGSSCAQRINRALSRRTGIRRRGCVFADRYHARALTNIAQVRNAIAYVLNNFRHHNLTGPTLADGRVDYYSSGILFMGWKERTLQTPCLPEDYPPPAIRDAEMWLLRHSWRRARPISVWEVPGA